MRGIGHAAALYQRNEAPGADTHTHTHTHTLMCTVSMHGFMMPVTSQLLIRLLERILLPAVSVQGQRRRQMQL